MTPRFLIRLLAALVFLSSFGCGLADYESKMKKSEALAQRFDEEFLLLDQPVQIPTYKVKDTISGIETVLPVVLLFLQPPKGISSEFIKDPGAPNVLHYRRKLPAKPTIPPGQPAPPPSPAGAVSDFLEVTVAWAKEKEPNKKKFADSILRLFPKGKGEVKKSEWSVTPLPRPRVRLDFETQEFFDPQENYCSVSIRSLEVVKEISLQSKETHYVAVVYKVEKGKQAQALKAQSLSLETLAMEKDEVLIATRDYNQHFPPPPPPPPSPQPGLGAQPGLPVPPK